MTQLKSSLRLSPNPGEIINDAALLKKQVLFRYLTWKQGQSFQQIKATDFFYICL